MSGGLPPPVADFTGVPTSGYRLLTVQFTDLSTGSISSWLWQFGDGETSAEQNPSHVYNATGTYTVSLTVTGSSGSDTEIKINYIEVTETPLVANFTGSPTSGYRPLTVQFTDTSSGIINSRAWNFGDGWTSSVQNPSHTYIDEGIYTVSLSVTGPGGIDTETKMNYITVTQPPQIGAHALETGKYEITGKGRNRTKTFIQTDSFIQGDAVIIRAYVKDTSTNSPLANATVNISITGPSNINLVTGPSNTSGIAEAQWKTSKPNKKGIGGTPTGLYSATITNVTATGYTWDGVVTNTRFTIQ